MSLNPGGRISGALHLYMQLPKSVKACVVAAGLSVVAVGAVPADQLARFVPLTTIQAYCASPAQSTLPAFVTQKFAKICQCASGGTVCI